MAELSDGARELLSRPIPGWLTTARADGTPHTTVLWVDVDGDDVICNTAVGRLKEKILRRNPHVSVAVLDSEDTHHLVSVSGIATLDEEGAVAMSDRLAKKYFGAEVHPGRTPNQVRITARIHPTQVVYDGGRH